MPRPGHPSRAYLLVVHAEAARELRRLRNVGPATAEDLLLLGVREVGDLVGEDPDEMYATLCRLDGARHDPCVRDVFASVVDQAEGRPAKPWHAYSKARKRADAARTFL